MSNDPVVDEVTLHCSDGIIIRGQRWRTGSSTRNTRRQRSTISSSTRQSSIHPNTNNNNDDESVSLITPNNNPDDGVNMIEPSYSHESLRILCLHGFMDNCRSFYQLAPKIVSHFNKNSDGHVEEGRLVPINKNITDGGSNNVDVRVDLVAFDFPGHGQSSHTSFDSTPTLVVTDLVYYVAEVVTQLGWQNGAFVLIGHSLGGIVSLMYAASFPNHVAKIFLLDAYGPEYDSPESVSGRIRRHVQERYEYNKDQFHYMTMANKSDDPFHATTSNAVSSMVTFPTRVYHSMDAAVQTRLQTARLSPGGHQWLSEEAAQELVHRSTRCVHQPLGSSHEITGTRYDGKDKNCWDGDDSSSKRRGEEGGVQFTHDNRMKYHHLMVHTSDQVDEYWKHLQCPVYCLMAREGWPFLQGRVERSYRWVRPPAVLTVHVLPGSHHFHADPTTADTFAETILRYI